MNCNSIRISCVTTQQKCYFLSPASCYLVFLFFFVFCFSFLSLYDIYFLILKKPWVDLLLLKFIKTEQTLCRYIMYAVLNKHTCAKRRKKEEKKLQSTIAYNGVGWTKDLKVIIWFSLEWFCTWFFVSITLFSAKGELFNFKYFKHKCLMKANKNTFVFLFEIFFFYNKRKVNEWRTNFDTLYYPIYLEL